MAKALTQSPGSMKIPNRRLQAIALIIFLAVVLALTLSRSFYDQIANNIFFSLTLAGCAIIFLSVRPLRELLQVLGVTVVLIGLQLAVLKVPLKVSPVFALLGLSSLFLLAVRRVYSSGSERKLLYDSLVPPLLFLLLGYFSSGPLALTFRLHPKTFDLFLYSFDQSLGVQLSFKVGQVILASHLLTRLTVAVYYLLPLAIMFTYARLLVRDRSLAMIAFLAFAVAGPAGVVFYNVIPGCGPGCLMGGKYPFETFSTEQLRQMPLAPLSEGGARNAFPSLHLVWALLTLWYSRILSRWDKVLLGIFCLGTVVATLGLGEHYFIDLVAAFPFALMVEAACALNVSVFNPRRIFPFLVGFGLMSGWVILLRWGLAVVWINPVIPWLLVAGTVFLTLVFEARMGTVLFAPGLDGNN
jgi:hypothetical protein